MQQYRIMISFSSLGHGVTKATPALFILLIAMIGITSLATQATLTLFTTSSLSMLVSHQSSAIQASEASDFKPMSTAISERADTQPECLHSTFLFKLITSSSMAQKQATQTAGDPLTSDFELLRLSSPTTFKSIAIQTARKLSSSPIYVRKLSSSPIYVRRPPRFLIQTDDCSISPSRRPSRFLIQTNDCAISPSIAIQIQTDDCSLSPSTSTSFGSIAHSPIQIQETTGAASRLASTPKSLVDLLLQSTINKKPSSASLQRIDLPLPLITVAINDPTSPLLPTTTVAIAGAASVDLQMRSTATSVDLPTPTPAASLPANLVVACLLLSSITMSGHPNALSSTVDLLSPSIAVAPLIVAIDLPLPSIAVPPQRIDQPLPLTVAISSIDMSFCRPQLYLHLGLATALVDPTLQSTATTLDSQMSPSPTATAPAFAGATEATDYPTSPSSTPSFQRPLSPTVEARSIYLCVPLLLLSICPCLQLLLKLNYLLTLSTLSSQLMPRLPLQLCGLWPSPSFSACR
jgi:hypothetical protein